MASEGLSEGLEMERGSAAIGDTLESAKAMLIDANQFCLRTNQKITPVGQGEIVKLVKIISAAQAEIDRLMLEFCPDEMTAEQRARWAVHQKPSEAREDLER